MPTPLLNRILCAKETGQMPECSKGLSSVDVEGRTICVWIKDPKEATKESILVLDNGTSVILGDYSGPKLLTIGGTREKLLDYRECVEGRQRELEAGLALVPVPISENRELVEEYDEDETEEVPDTQDEE